MRERETRKLASNVGIESVDKDEGDGGDGGADTESEIHNYGEGNNQGSTKTIIFLSGCIHCTSSCLTWEVFVVPRPSRSSCARKQGK